MARLSLIRIMQDKHGNDHSFTYAIEKHPKTRLVIQRNPDGYWFIYKLIGKNARMLTEQAFKTEKAATTECMRLAEMMF